MSLSNDDPPAEWITLCLGSILTSFVAFDGNPLKDFEVTRRIGLCVKDGQILELGPPPPEQD